MCLREVGFYDIYRKIKVYTTYIAIILSISSPLLALDSTWVFLAGGSCQSYYRDVGMLHVLVKHGRHAC